VIDGNLHMRFSARKRYINWKPSVALEQARKFLMVLLNDPCGPVFRHRLAAGEGLICNNVLHTRSAFEDGAGHGRLLYRARFGNRVSDIERKVKNA